MNASDVHAGVKRVVASSFVGLHTPYCDHIGIYQGGWWSSQDLYMPSVFVHSLTTAPERVPVRGEMSTKPWNALLYAHGLFYYASIGILFGVQTSTVLDCL